MGLEVAQPSSLAMQQYTSMSMQAASEDSCKTLTATLVARKDGVIECKIFQGAENVAVILVDTIVIEGHFIVLESRKQWGNKLGDLKLHDIKIHLSQIDFLIRDIHINTIYALNFGFGNVVSVWKSIFWLHYAVIWKNEVGNFELKWGIFNIQFHIQFGKIQFNPTKLHFCHQSTQTLDGDVEFEGYSSKIQNDNRMLLEENVALRQQLREKDEIIKEMKRNFQTEIRKISEEKLLSENMLMKVENDYKDALLELGRLTVEYDAKTNRMKENEQFQKIFPPKSLMSSVANVSEGNNSSAFSPRSIVLSSDVPSHDVPTKGKMNQLPVSSLLSPSGEQSVGTSRELVESNARQGNDHKKESEAQNRNQAIDVGPTNALIATNEQNVPGDQLPLSIAVEEINNAEPISLTNEPSSSVAADVYNAYKLLLLTISGRLQRSDVIKLKEWANEKFSVDTNLSANDVILQLDRKGVVTASDLSQLRVFFESITRFDLVYLIDEFNNGDYAKLRKLIHQNKSKNNSHNRVGNLTRVSSRSILRPNNNAPEFSRWPRTDNRNVSNAQVLEQPSTAEATTSMAHSQQRMKSSRSNFPSTSNSNVEGATAISLHGNSENVRDGTTVNNIKGNPGNERRVRENDCPVTTGNVRGTTISKSPEPSSQSNNNKNPAGKCNGHSHRHTDDHVHGSNNGKKQDEWLCNHYKRRCYVKFECCDKYWPCHRCHNNESTCGRRKLKSRDTLMVKCAECGKEQQFGENGQFCVDCNTQFADFFCGVCKHLTGRDDHPYHCDKCGICRIHGDRSYHCDVCGICLDVQLRNNHKCRPDSAHDECCICLEDAFTGCQILPCSHKVHKECATQMIRNGITRCPICRESFAHKLERRPERPVGRVRNRRRR